MYVPTPDDVLRSTGARISRHDGSLPSGPAVTSTSGWSVLTVVYWFAPGVQVWARRVQASRRWLGASPATSVVRVVPSLRVVS